MSKQKSWIKQKVQVLGSDISFVEKGVGDPIVFLHGNPTSSFLWRNVMPHLEKHGRCLAIDLIGMGDSDKLIDSGASRYTFAEHYDYLEGAFSALGIEKNVTLVVHDWGSALGFHWANQHRSQVKGICYMEAIVRPITWDEFPEAARDIFKAFRSSAGEEMILERNLFVEAVLPGSILRQLDEGEMNEYRRPFIKPGENRRPTLTWPREIPIEGEPRNVVELVNQYSRWLSEDEIVPKLFINADPGALLTGDVRDYCRKWANQKEITVAGNHFLQEDSPEEIGIALREWYSDLT